MAWRMDGLGMRRIWAQISGACIFVVLMTIAPLAAMDLNGYAKLGLERLQGHTSYEIGGLIAVSGEENRSAHFPFSKLEFPLTGYMGTTAFGLNVGEVLRVDLGLKKSILREEATIEDWDWGYWHLADHPWARSSTLDIYSTSRSSVDAWMGDAKVRWCFNLTDRSRPQDRTEVRLMVGGGYSIQVFDYDMVDDLDQWYPSYPQYADAIENDPTISPALKQTIKGHVYNSGNVLSYHVEYEVPFLEGGVQLGLGERLDVEACLGYSFWVKAKDTDHHLLRGKVSKGDCGGTAVLFTLNGDYAVTDRIVLGLNYRRIVITATGIQDQSAANYSASVDQHIESDQQSFGVSLGFCF